MDAYIIHLAILFLIYAILGVSLNLVVGHTGLLSVTHAAFYGVGAYAAAILTTKAGANFFAALLIGIVLAMLIALLVGFVFSKFRGDYYALGTLGFNVIVWSIFLNWEELTRGPLGIPGIPRPEIFGVSLSSNFSFLILAAALFALTYTLARFIEQSSFGRALKAIREDEEVLRIFGYNVHHFKLAIFTISAGIAAVAGAMYASYITFIDPGMFTINESVFVLAIIILGGLASLRGSVVGALFLVLLPELLRFAGFPNEIAAQMRQAIYGLILTLLMLYRPQGLFGEYRL